MGLYTGKVPNVPKHMRFNESHVPIGQDLYAELKKIEEQIKLNVRNDSGIVSEIMNFNDYKQFTDYSKKFDWVQTDFLKTFITVVLERLLETPTQNDFFIEIEEKVKLHFGVNLSMQSIFMRYEDTRFERILEFKTPKEKPQPVYYNPSTLAPTYIEFDSHTFYNRPITHHAHLRHKLNDKNEEFIDVEKTLEHFIYEFVVFANVVDKEHDGILWVANKEEERKVNYSDRSLPDLSFNLPVNRPLPDLEFKVDPKLVIKPKVRTIIE